MATLVRAKVRAVLLALGWDQVGRVTQQAEVDAVKAHDGGTVRWKEGDAVRACL